MYSDFGGAQEKNESPRQVAIREGNEESNGILGDMKKLIKKSPKYIGDDKYRVYDKSAITKKIPMRNIPAFIFPMW